MVLVQPEAGPHQNNAPQSKHCQQQTHQTQSLGWEKARHQNYIQNTEILAKILVKRFFVRSHFKVQTILSPQPKTFHFLLFCIIFPIPNIPRENISHDWLDMPRKMQALSIWNHDNLTRRTHKKLFLEMKQKYLRNAYENEESIVIKVQSFTKMKW